MFLDRVNEKCQTIEVSVIYKDDLVNVVSEDDTFTFEFDDISSSFMQTERQDFAVWIFLPIAMKANANLHIKGTGTQETINNAAILSQIWSMWMPSQFRDVQVTFENILSTQCNENHREDALCFYSGGIDSTYCISELSKNNIKPSLLTVHGMEYSVDNTKLFADFQDKTAPFAEQYGNKRFFIRTNAYQIYGKYKINTKGHHVTHIFTLAGCGFLFSGYFSEIIIAADYRLDQQFLVYPWGSNSATNHLFNDGITCLITKNDDITRSEKLLSLLESSTALNSLTFCVDQKSRPHNCGICSKCTRTKLMFLAATGTIPDVFSAKEVNSNILDSIKISKLSERAFMLDLYYSAKRNHRLHLMPNLEQLVNSIATLPLKKRKTKPSLKAKKTKLSLKEKIKNVVAIHRNSG